MSEILAGLKKIGGSGNSKLELYDSSSLVFSNKSNTSVDISNMPLDYDFFVFTEQNWTSVIAFIYEKSTQIIYPLASTYIEPTPNFSARVEILSDTSIRVTCSGGMSMFDARTMRIFL